MQRTLLKSKIHRAVVTEACLEYEGSVTIDGLLLDAADILEHEQVHLYDVTNGERIVTYAIRGEPGSGVVQVNGAAARRVKQGDVIIVASYAQYSEAEARSHKPRIVRVDRENRVAEPEREEVHR